MSNTTNNIQKRLSEMSESEKVAFFEATEFLLDNGEGRNISYDDIALFNALIKERTQQESSQPSLNEQIQSAETRQLNQDVDKEPTTQEKGR